MKGLKKALNIFLCISIALIITLFTAGQTKAATSTFNFDVTFSGMSPGGTTPYLTVTFDDGYGDANTVRLFIDVLNLDSYSSVTQLYFNFDPALTLAANAFTPVYTSDSIPNSVTWSPDTYKADGDGLYDIFFDMPPPAGMFAERLTNGEQLVYDITFTSAADVTAFNFLSAPDGGQGAYFAAAHIQGIGDGSTSNSGWVGVVPEPISSTLFIIGAVTLGFRRFCRKRRAAQ